MKGEGMNVGPKYPCNLLTLSGRSSSCYPGTLTTFPRLFPLSIRPLSFSAPWLFATVVLSLRSFVRPLLTLITA